MGERFYAIDENGERAQYEQTPDGNVKVTNDASYMPAPGTTGNPNTWNPFNGQFYGADGNAVTESDFYLQQGQAAGRRLGAIPFTQAELAQMNGGTMPTAPSADYGYYNAGPGGAMWVSKGDARFMPQPQHNDSFGEAVGDTFNMNKNGGWKIPLMALGAYGLSSLGAAGAAEGAGAGGAEAGGGAAMAGGGEVGSGYAASAPGWDGAATGAAEAGGIGAGSGGGGGVSDGYFDDFSGQWVDGTGGGGSVGDPNATGAFDQGGSQGVFDASGNPLYSSPTSLSSLYDQAKGLAAQFGITPASALSLLKGALRGAPAVAGAIGANRQAESLQGLADQYMGMGAPSRARYEASFQPGFSMSMDPGYQDALDQTTKSFLHKASISGNPAESPNAWQQTLKDVNSQFAYPALQNYRNQNAATSGIAAFSNAAPGMAGGAVNAQGNIFNALGAGAADIFNPPKSLAQSMDEYDQLRRARGGI